MGKATEVDGDNNPTSDSDPAKLLEAALLQMDGIIAGEWLLFNVFFNGKCVITLTLIIPWL